MQTYQWLSSCDLCERTWVVEILSIGKNGTWWKILGAAILNEQATGLDHVSTTAHRTNPSVARKIPRAHGQAWWTWNSGTYRKEGETRRSRLQSVGKSSQKAPWQLESGWSALTCKMELLAKVRPWRRSWSMSSTCMGSMQGMGRRLWECNVTGGLQSSLLEVLASYYVVWQYLCHICCAQHGSPWNEIVGASRATSNKDLQFASMPCLFGAMLGRDDFASILFGGNGQEASLKMPSSLTTGI